MTTCWAGVWSAEQTKAPFQSRTVQRTFTTSTSTRMGDGSRGGSSLSWAPAGIAQTESRTASVNGRLVAKLQHLTGIGGVRPGNTVEPLHLALSGVVLFHRWA